MSARRPLQPLSPLSANIVGANYSYVSKVGAFSGADGYNAMDERVQDDNTQGSGSVLSGLTSLENDADDFDRLMLQQARDERRLQNSLRGNVRPFRKARTHPNVGLTLENLERNNVGMGLNAQVKFERPPSVGSSRSSGSDPAVRVPVEWGRKGRVRRDWLRTITSDDEQKPGVQEDSVADDATPRQEADRARPSIEDSPLSHKSGTPSSTRRSNATLPQMNGLEDTIDFNEASLIASTPYIPRNTALDDIRQREISSLREQAVTTNRLDKIRENSPEERRPRSSSRNSLNDRTNGAVTEQATEGAASPGKLRKRTNSWKTIGKSQPVTGDTADQTSTSPIQVYRKGSETVGTVDREVSANAQNRSQRPTHRREDSHDLLRRLARVSSGTPSPGRVASARPQTAPARQTENLSQSMPSQPSSGTMQDVQNSQASRDHAPVEEEIDTAPRIPSSKDQPISDQQHQPALPDVPGQMTSGDIDATPMPIEQSLLHAKTPRVTGAWIDTPAPRAAPRPAEPSRSRSRSTKKASSSKKAIEEECIAEKKQASESSTFTDRAWPNHPRSALEAIVEEAKANEGNRRHDDALGDSTIDSLEELLTPGADGGREQEDDTLIGLQLPTGVPRNEGERQRQQELVHLHRMNERLRAARTSIRDASRGMKRVEREVENAGSVHEEAGKVVFRDCPCATDGHYWSPWSSAWHGFKRLFYDPEHAKRAGLSWLSIILISSCVWYILETVAYNQHGHKFYANSMNRYGIVWDAPTWPFVIPTLLYRTLLKPFCEPFWSLFVWIYRFVYNCFFEDEVVKQTATRTARRLTRTVLAQGQEEYTLDPDLSMNNDEIL